MYFINILYDGPTQTLRLELESYLLAETVWTKKESEFSSVNSIQAKNYEYNKLEEIKQGQMNNLYKFLQLFVYF